MSKSAILLPAFILALQGCARPVNRAAERKIRDALPSYIGPARSWKAHIDNPPARTVSGRLARVLIEGEAVDLQRIVHLSRLRLEMLDAEVDTARSRLRSVGRTTFEATVSEANLNDYLKRSDSPDDSVRISGVRLGNNRVSIHAAYRLLGRDVPFSAEVEPRLASPTKLEFDPNRFSLLGIGIPLPAGILRWISQRLTDGFDFSALPFPLAISTVRVRGGEVELKGTADVMRSLNERISKYIARPGWP